MAACVSEALRTSGGAMTEGEATGYCSEVFDCIWAEAERFIDVEVSVLFDCIEDVLEQG